MKWTPRMTESLHAVALMAEAPSLPAFVEADLTPSRDASGAGQAARLHAALAAARLAALNDALLWSSSATLALEAWCGMLSGRTAPARISAEILDRRTERDIAPERRQRLGIGPQAALRYRHVRLRLGNRVLSDAENWYVPERLTPAMNRLLEQTGTPFGRVVCDRLAGRRLLVARVLWTPAEGTAPPRRLLRHQALLLGHDGVPFSEVDEIYGRDALFLAEPGP
jgi:hypothetical protein